MCILLYYLLEFLLFLSRLFFFFFFSILFTDYAIRAAEKQKPMKNESRDRRDALYSGLREKANNIITALFTSS